MCISLRSDYFQAPNENSAELVVSLQLKTSAPFLSVVKQK